MRKPDRVEMNLDRLHELRASGDTGALARFLDDRANVVIAKAADIAGDLRAAELVPKLASTFERLMRNPASLDKGCAALTAIARALYTMESNESTAFRAGIRHVQMEPSWGPPVDAAVELRGICALGLTQTHYDGTLFELVRLLGDREWKARVAAARALACMNDPGASLVLQYKASIGDEEPDVTAESLAGVIAQDPSRYRTFVIEFLDGATEDVAESAILALGAVRSDAATGILVERWKRSTSRTLRQALLTALAGNRSDQAVEFLLNRIADEDDECWAESIVAALERCRANERVLERAREALAHRA